jgi:hypothetical protein
MKPVSVLLLVVFALAAGCDRAARVLEPPVAELAEVQGLARLGDRAALADWEIRCSLGEPGCARVYETTGDACLRLAQDAFAAGRAAEARPRANCARDRYDALFRASGEESVSVRGLEALRLLRESSGRIEQAAQANAALERRAEAHLAAFPASGAGNYYLATTFVWRVAFDRSRDSCADLERARSLAAAAATAPPNGTILDSRSAAADVSRRAAVIARERGCAT